MRVPAFAVLLSFLLLVATIARTPQPLRAAEGRAEVRLVRLLGEVPDSDRVALGRVHDLRLRLERGNVFLLRRGGEYAAILPIEPLSGAKDSLRYFYYVEHPNFLWVFPGQRGKGISVVGDGGALTVNSFRVRWRPSPGGFGWIYFPDDESTRNVSFSVVSGRTVDDADPMRTKYWIELAPPGAGGF